MFTPSEYKRIKDVLGNDVAAKMQLLANSSGISKTNYTATADPDPAVNNSSQGYSVGSEWFNTLTNTMFKFYGDSVGWEIEAIS